MAPDDMLVRALNQHAGGWRAVPLTEPPEAGALVIVDLDDAAERRVAVGTLREAGFDGPILILGARDAAAPDDEPIARPVRLGVLLARIEAHWTEGSEAELLQLGPYEFVPAEQLLRDRGSD